MELHTLTLTTVQTVVVLRQNMDGVTKIQNKKRHCHGQCQCANRVGVAELPKAL